MNFLQSMLSEDGSAQNVSTMRVATLLVVVIVLGTWAAVSLERGALQPFSPELAALVIGALGVKAWQRGKEEARP